MKIIALVAMIFVVGLMAHEPPFNTSFRQRHTAAFNRRKAPPFTFISHDGSVKSHNLTWKNKMEIKS